MTQHDEALVWPVGARPTSGAGSVIGGPPDPNSKPSFFSRGTWGEVVAATLATSAVAALHTSSPVAAYRHPSPVTDAMPLQGRGKSSETALVTDDTPMTHR